MHYVIVSATAMLTAVIACGIMLMIPGIGDSTAAMVGAAAAVAGWKTVMSRRDEA